MRRCGQSGVAYITARRDVYSKQRDNIIGTERNSPERRDGRRARTRRSGAMLAYAILTLMALAGYAGAPPWVALFGAAGVATEGWWLKLQLRHRHPRDPWSAKITTYFITGILANIGLSALAYSAGWAARALTG